MSKKPFLAAPLLAAFALAGFSAPAAADDFLLDTAWGRTPPCNTGSPHLIPNPAFALSGVPPRTRVLVFEMLDLNAPGFKHGGGTVRYKGQRLIAPGAFSYLGPCPPAGETHRYIWTVYAKDGPGTFATELGKAEVVKSFPR
ncbi:phospholipid-binding protein [Oryzibacter oryziterrae]|uniref:phospholipid-binding protein n=1 Tax=Oryzibacter oryziterrae TaxID=2766474 RepID=UPI001F2F2F48|nr:phospholipid-binding protein [Oryzibacter oryziterrae]